MAIKVKSERMPRPVVRHLRKKQKRQEGKVLVRRVIDLVSMSLGEFPVSDEQTGKDDSRVESQH